MGSGGKRENADRPKGSVKPPSVQLSFQISQELADRLEAAASKSLKTRSRFVQEAILAALATVEGKA